jgi:ribose 5-phosphate isomerase RpiB
MDLNKICAGLTLAERDELLQIVTSYIDSIDKTFMSSLDVVCTGCASGKTARLTYSKTNGTRCAECKTKLSPNAPKISQINVTILPLPHTLTPCIGDAVHVHNTTFVSAEEDFTKIDIQAPLIYDPNVVLTSDSFGGGGGGRGRGQFLKPGGL